MKNIEISVMERRQYSVVHENIFQQLVIILKIRSTVRDW